MAGCVSCFGTAGGTVVAGGTVTVDRLIYPITFYAGHVLNILSKPLDGLCGPCHIGHCVVPGSAAPCTTQPPLVITNTTIITVDKTGSVDNTSTGGGGVAASTMAAAFVSFAVFCIIIVLAIYYRRRARTDSGTSNEEIPEIEHRYELPADAIQRPLRTMMADPSHLYQAIDEYISTDANDYMAPVSPSCGTISRNEVYDVGASGEQVYDMAQAAVYETNESSADTGSIIYDNQRTNFINTATTDMAWPVRPTVRLQSDDDVMSVCSDASGFSTTNDASFME